MVVKFVAMLVILTGSVAARAQIETVDDVVALISSDGPILEHDATAVRAWVESQIRFESELDAEISDEMRRYVDSTYELAAAEVPSGRERERLTLARGHFLDTLALFGTAKDFQRFNAFRAYRLQLTLLQKLNPETSSSMRLRLADLWRRLVFIVHRAIALSGPFAQLAWASVIDGARASNGTPTTLAANKFFEATAKVDGFDVVLQGDTIVTGRSPSAVNLIVLNHVSAVHDAMVIAALGLDSYLTFGAINLDGEGMFSLARLPIMRPVLRRITANRDVILLGQGGDPIQRIVQSVLEGRSNNILVFPQGMVSAGFDETLPIKANFSQKLLGALNAAGVSTRLQIVTMPDNFDFVSLAKIDSRTKRLRAFIDKPIEASALARLETIAGPRAVDAVIRATWIRRITETQTSYRGYRLQNIRTCEGLFK